MSDLKASSAALVHALDVAVPGALSESATRIARDAAAHAPVLKAATAYRVPGALKNAIGVQRKPAGNGQFKVSVGIDESAAFYGRFQEFGFHTRRSEGSARFIPGLHFLQRAFEDNQVAVVALVSERVKAVLDQANQ